jgi:spore maturation protein CgeB
MTRILVIHPGPQFSVADVHAGYVEALRELGMRVAAFNLDDRLNFYNAALFETGTHNLATGAALLRKAVTFEQAKGLAANGIYAAAYKFAPEVALVISCFFVPVELLDILRSRGTRVVLLHTESPYQDTEQLERAAHADLNLVNDPANLAAFQALGPAEYLPHAYRPAIHYPGAARPDMLCDLAFVGTGFPSRIRFLEAMHAARVLPPGTLVNLAGQWQELPEDSPIADWLATDRDECLDNAQTAALYRSAKAGLNLYRAETNPGDDTDGWAMSPREVEMAACGLPFARQPRGEGDQVLGMLPTFASPEEAAKALADLLADPQRRARLADQARAAIDDRTFLHNAARLLRLLDRLPARPVPGRQVPARGRA